MTWDTSATQTNVVCSLAVACLLLEPEGLAMPQGHVTDTGLILYFLSVVSPLPPRMSKLY